ncbi:hypothetical protein [Amycolatopsis sp. SID8362]|uniref:hypothetical protein n=1 Tax=Amycolatopsis sp. SID8362 TaxID=2690346 RepID=UPI00136A8A77|nr:hypothetical protein [Amycolatopsis sp. SID8362]NBH02869.1 hypothetical protein [Amycolatopsis sp. SID8362]NED39570.1 hypothetical protein [Amycolatopsis sp. SID8362]
MMEQTTSRPSTRGDLEPTPIYDAVSVLLQAQCHAGQRAEETAATSVTADQPVPAKHANAAQAQEDRAVAGTLTLDRE